MTLDLVEIGDVTNFNGLKRRIALMILFAIVARLFTSDPKQLIAAVMSRTSLTKLEIAKLASIARSLLTLYHPARCLQFCLTTLMTRPLGLLGV
jgi:hypothetical protein